MAKTFLMADMGGTNIRFSIFDGKRSSKPVHYKCADFSTLSGAVSAYRKTVECQLPSVFILAVPGPVGGDSYSFVNNPWHFSIRQLQSEFDFEKIHIVNDFEAAAMALPFLLHKNDLYRFGPAVDSDLHAPRLVIGAGTGLGVGILVPLEQGGFRPIASEGGHICVSDATPEEEKIVNHVFDRFGRISAERLVSGQGLSNIYRALTEQDSSSEEIVQAALDGDSMARQSVLQMFTFWGDVAGDLALAVGARGGVYLSGGIIQIEGMKKFLEVSDFRARFEAKGRRRAYVSGIPTFVITKKDTAFLGLEAIGIQENEKK